MESGFKNKFFLSKKKCHSYILAEVYLKKVKENILLSDCSFKNHLNNKNYKCCWFNVVNDQRHIQTSLSLYEKFICKGRWEGENGQEVLCLFPTYCPFHFVTSHSCVICISRLPPCKKWSTWAGGRLMTLPFHLCTVHWKLCLRGEGVSRGLREVNYYYFHSGWWWFTCSIFPRAVRITLWSCSKERVYAFNQAQLK